MATIKLFFETKQIDLTVASTAYKVYNLRGGEVVLIKAKRANTGNIFIGDKDVKTSNGYELGPGEGIKVKIGEEINSQESIEIYAAASTAGDDVTYFVLPYYVKIG